MIPYRTGRARIFKPPAVPLQFPNSPSKAGGSGGFEIMAPMAALARSGLADITPTPRQLSEWGEILHQAMHMNLVKRLDRENWVFGSEFWKQLEKAYPEDFGKNGKIEGGGGGMGGGMGGLMGGEYSRRDKLPDDFEGGDGGEFVDRDGNRYKRINRRPSPPLRIWRRN